MTKVDFSDEILMRFADGELDPATSARIEHALETDDDLLARLALFTETRAQTQAALKPLLDEQVPDHLVAAVQRMVDEKRAGSNKTSPADVVPFRKRAHASPLNGKWALPIAASLVAALLGGLAGHWLSSNNGRAADGLQVAGVGGGPALVEALATSPAGTETRLPGSNQRFRIIATFRDSQETLCREFEVDSPDRSTVISVACHSDDQWRVSFAVVAPGNSDGYAPASSTEALDAYLAAINAGAPMSAEEEEKALRTISGKIPE